VLVNMSAAGFAEFAGSLPALRVLRARPEAADDRLCDGRYESAGDLRPNGRSTPMAAGDTQITIAGIRDLRSHAPIGVAYAECRRRELPSEL
jgi:hypothetical protein